MKYQVITQLGASVCEDVEAKTPEQALKRAARSASVCHACSREVEIGDPISSVVLDEDGETVLDEEADEQARLKALEAVAKAARELCQELASRQSQGPRFARRAVDLRDALAKLDGAK